MLVKNIGRLALVGIHKDFYQGGVAMHVLNGIDIEFLSGKTYAITGVSGSGKSTLLHIAGGLDLPTLGRVTLNEHNIYSVRPRAKEKILNREFGFVFQFHYLIKEFTVLENIMLVGFIKGESKKKCALRAHELLELVDLTDKKDCYPGQLSGGQQQRVAIARAIFNKPLFLVADEPTGNLDFDNAQKVVDLILQAKSEWGMGVILCSHDANVYGKMENVYTLNNGILASK